MNKLIVLLGLLVLLFASTTAPAYANTIAVTPMPTSIATGGITNLNTCDTTPASADTITSIKVTDPSGTIWTYTGAVPSPAPGCAGDFTSTFAPPFGASSPNWSSNDGDVSQTDESGTYHVEVLYNEAGRVGGPFDASAPFTAPEFLVPAVLPAAAAFAVLAIRRLRESK